MGFDLYGIKPQSDRPEPPQPSINKAGKWTDKEKKQWEIYEEWREESGGYFRNNVWWWRPLWDFVCDVCDDILIQKDRDLGHGNFGHKITKKKAEAIADRLYALLNNGHVEEYEKEHQERINGLDKKDWNRNYPFHKGNVKAFADFCAKCGGFEIC